MKVRITDYIDEYDLVIEMEVRETENDWDVNYIVDEFKIVSVNKFDTGS